MQSVMERGGMSAWQHKAARVEAGCVTSQHGIVTVCVATRSCWRGLHVLTTSIEARSEARGTHDQSGVRPSCISALIATSQQY